MEQCNKSSFTIKPQEDDLDYEVDVYIEELLKEIKKVHKAEKYL